MSVKRVAVIGLGAMGTPIAHRLLGTGCRITVWNRSPQRVAALQEAGAVAAAVDDRELRLGLTSAARGWLSDAERAGRAHQDYSAVLAHILHAATKGLQR